MNTEGNTCKDFDEQQDALRFSDELRNQGIKNEVYHMNAKYTVFYAETAIPTAQWQKEAEEKGKIDLLNHLILRWDLVDKPYLQSILSTLTTK